MNSFWAIFDIVILLLFSLFTLAYASYTLYFKIKCRNMHDCIKENCINRKNCRKTKITENTKKRLQNLVDSLED